MTGKGRSGDTTDKAHLTHTVDLKVFSLDAVKKACYRLAALADFHLTESSVGKLDINISVAASAADAGHGLKKVLSRLEQEILDQDLRETLADKTRDIRTLILAEAFKNTTLIDK